MSQVALYRDMTLCSYDYIRRREERVEGVGSASPFSMGLNALVTRNVAGLVRSLTLQGQWKEHDLQEFASVGRVPDDAMMLNIAVRAAVDRCCALESFKSVFQKKNTAPGSTAHISQMGSEHQTTLERLFRPGSFTKITQLAHSLSIQSFSSAAGSYPRNASSAVSNNNRHRPSVLSRRHCHGSIRLTKT